MIKLITYNITRFRMFYFYWNWNYYTERSNADIFSQRFGSSANDAMPWRCDGTRGIIISDTDKTIK